MVNIQTAIEQGRNKLVTPDARIDAEILLGHVLNKNRAYLFAYPEKELTQKQLDTYHQYLQQRVAGEPIAYIIGTREFWTLTLAVNRSTLIPRHETERVVELVLELVPNQADTQVLDLGTGSGAIALAIAKERPDWHVDACDYSEEALKMAQHNAKNNNVSNISFYKSNWFDDIPKKRYHVIVSNPPYIAPDDPHLLEGDLRYEPQTALVSGQKGLADLQYIINSSKDFLLPEGLLLLEHGFDQKIQVNAILNRSGYKKVQSWQDVLGHDRVSGGWRFDITT